MKAKKLLSEISAHNRNKTGKGLYHPCYCMNCESKRSQYFALTGKGSPL